AARSRAVRRGVPAVLARSDGRAQRARDAAAAAEGADEPDGVAPAQRGVAAPRAASGRTGPARAAAAPRYAPRVLRRRDPAPPRLRPDVGRGAGARARTGPPVRARRAPAGHAAHAACAARRGRSRADDPLGAARLRRADRTAPPRPDRAAADPG